MCGKQPVFKLKWQVCTLILSETVGHQSISKPVYRRYSASFDIGLADSQLDHRLGQPGPSPVVNRASRPLVLVKRPLEISLFPFLLNFQLIAKFMEFLKKSDLEKSSGFVSGGILRDLGLLKRCNNALRSIFQRSFRKYTQINTNLCHTISVVGSGRNIAVAGWQLAVPGRAETPPKCLLAGYGILVSICLYMEYYLERTNSIHQKYCGTYP